MRPGHDIVISVVLSLKQGQIWTNHKHETQKHTGSASKAFQNSHDMAGVENIAKVYALKMMFLSGYMSVDGEMLAETASSDTDWRDF